MGPGVERLPAQLGSEAVEEPSRLPVVRVMVDIFVGEDHRQQAGVAQGSRHARKRGESDYGRCLAIVTELVFLAYLPQPVDLRFLNGELIVVQLSDLDEGVRIGEDFVRDNDLCHLNAKAVRKQVPLAPTLSASLLCPGRPVLSVCRVRRGRLELSQNIFPEVELPLVRVMALRLAPEEAVLKRCDDLVLSGEFAFGGG